MDSGPPSSFEDWLRRARPRLLRLAVSRLRDVGEAEDVVQETVLAVWRRHQAGAVEDLDAYANRAVWQNAIRRKTRWRDWEELTDAEAWAGGGGVPDAEAWLEARDLEEAIAGLPETQQAVIRLRFYSGMSFKEMATALSIGLNTAASRTRYALEALRQGLRNVYTEEQTKEANHGFEGKRKRPGKGRPGPEKQSPGPALRRGAGGRGGGA